MKKKVNIYVDGFNFYYGLKDMVKHKRDWRKFYWIDLVKLFEQFLLEDEDFLDEDDEDDDDEDDDNGSRLRDKLKEAERLKITILNEDQIYSLRFTSNGDVVSRE